MMNLSLFKFEMPIRRPRGDVRRALGYMNLELGGGTCIRLEIQVWEPSG